MTYTFSPLKTNLTDIENWLVKECSGIRTGQATPLILDGILVESYGAKMPVKNIASINIEDSKTLRITPWDKSQIKTIETALAQSNLGISSAPDADGLRVVFPALTEDRRKTFSKLVGEKLEEARISVRQEREKVWNDIQAQEKTGTLSEDDKFRLKDELQKLIDATNAKLESIAERKQVDIMS